MTQPQPLRDDATIELLWTMLDSLIESATLSHDDVEMLIQDLERQSDGDLTASLARDDYAAVTAAFADHGLDDRYGEMAVSELETYAENFPEETVSE